MNIKFKINYLFFFVIILSGCRKVSVVNIYESQLNPSKQKFLIEKIDSVNFNYSNEFEISDYDPINKTYLAYSPKDKQIIVFDSLGQKLFCFNRYGTKQNQYSWLSGISFINHNQILAIASPNKILKYSFNGDLITLDSIEGHYLPSTLLTNLIVLKQNNIEKCICYSIANKLSPKTTDFFDMNEFFVLKNLFDKSFVKFGKMDSSNFHKKFAEQNISLGNFEPSICFNSSKNTIYTIFACDPHIYKYNLNNPTKIEKTIETNFENFIIKGFDFNAHQIRNENCAQIISEVFVRNSFTNYISSFKNYILLNYISSIDSSNYTKNTTILNNRIERGNLRRYNYLSLFVNEKKLCDYKLDESYEYLALARDTNFLLIKKYNPTRNHNEFYISKIKFL